MLDLARRFGSDVREVLHRWEELVGKADVFDPSALKNFLDPTAGKR